MDFSYLERRIDTRRAAYMPIELRLDDSPQALPAHLVDLSQGGAGIMTTAMNAPMLGQRIDMIFQTFSDEPTENPRQRRETGVVVNLRAPQRGVTRCGVRFLHRREDECDLIDPIDPLRDDKKTPPAPRFNRRWETARGFSDLEQLEESSVGAN
ncbi:PilZ domain protein [Phycisphaerae bacterium RAS2]|nr:PilZ domain protein [Phycisphaerae bacterium RAS2]